ncbi:hypothetical protein NBH00_13775 [Paraconexibacter antarcticus]|uniref:ArsA/GET3 Anion-transporting ATPase-like domain-containing protein n=1 Tax=Paraconexibacter antarcticus TaxID=2949664 RepID=A0ABY5DNW4_9ACTN|nr:ArsA-related P-loop ATPase [Paraconexibacter antarcticus]UTI62430.1 hypothetical protein NBH00_13775 [Paraconexibacter antarcticus]
MTATPLFDRSMVLVTGKGGVGKSTIAAALGRAAAARGLRTMVCEVSQQSRVAALLGAEAGPLGEEREVEPGLWTASIDPDDALKAWLARQLGSRPLVNILTRSDLFGYFVAAAPGARELVTMTRVWEMSQRDRWRKGDQGYDIVIADLPASGHALGMIRAPKTFRDIARIGPIASQAGAVVETLDDPARSALVAVTLPGELPVSEALDLEGRAVETLGRPVDLIVVNDLMTRRWTPAEAASLDGQGGGRAKGAAVREAAQTAMQQRQLRRLRGGATAPVLTLPRVSGVVTPEVVRDLGARLASALAGRAG